MKQYNIMKDMIEVINTITDMIEDETFIVYNNITW